MVVLKTARELKVMQIACQISAKALQLAGKAVEPGVSTAEIDRIAEEYIRSQGAIPNFKNYNGYPATTCISINNEVIHGIPNKNRIIQNGDIVSIDLGAAYEGYNGDNAATFVAGDTTEKAKRLLKVTEQSLIKGIAAALAGNRIGDISNAVQTFVETNGYSVVREYVGHGIGTKLHESPEVPNYGKAGHGIRLVPGMTLAIEPMVNEGRAPVSVQPDGWTVLTADGSLSAHFEHTVVITADGPKIMTKI